MRIIYLIGTRIRNPSFRKTLSKLKESESYTIDKLEEIQLQKLKKLYCQARKTKFYKSKYDQYGVDFEDIHCLDDLIKLPTITKSELLNNTKFIQLKEGFKKLIFSETSGSTGEPLKFYRNEEWDSAHRAAQVRGYSWFHINPWEKNGYLWGYNRGLKSTIITKFLDSLLNRFRVFSLETKDMDRFLRKCKKAKYLEGYSSMIYEFAKRANKTLISLPKLDMVKGTSEKIYGYYQDEVIKAFGTKMVSEYGAAEAGIIAFECPYGNMHIVMENVIVEQIDGEIVITNLDSLSFPIIRYKLGDFIELDTTTKCSCGMNHHIIREVTGRVGKAIRGKTKNYPSLTLYYVFKNLAINQNIELSYQAIQNEVGVMELRISEVMSYKTLQILKSELFKYFQNDLTININNESFVRSNRNKLKDFISTIPEN